MYAELANRKVSRRVIADSCHSHRFELSSRLIGIYKVASASFSRCSV